MSFLTKRLTFSGKKTAKKGIIIYFCHDNINGYRERVENLKIDEFGREYSGEELCEIACVYLGISWLVSPMVWVARKSGEAFEWVGVEEKIECKANTTENLYFRFRLWPSERGLRILKSSRSFDFQYFMLQVREDFLASRFTFKNDVSDIPFTLGRAVSDKLRFMKLYNMDLEHANKISFSHFIPLKVIKEHFNNFLSRKDLMDKLAMELESYCKTHPNVEQLELMHAMTLEVIRKINNYAVQKIIFDESTVTVQPYHPEFPGVVIHPNNGRERFYSKIGDITDISIDANKMIMIHRKGGTPLKITYKDRSKALELCCLLDGYYRMSVDYNTPLCYHTTSAFSTFLKKNNLYGPVSKEWAKKRLSEKYQADEARNYLVKLSRSRPGLVSLLYIQPSDRITSVEISYDVIGKVFTLMKEQDEDDEEEDGISSEEDDDCEEIGNSDGDANQHSLGNKNIHNKNNNILNKNNTNDLMNDNLGFNNLNFHDSAEPNKLQKKEEEEEKDGGGGSGGTLKKSSPNRTKSLDKGGGTFKDLPSLVDFYRDKFHLKQCVKPSFPYDSWIYLCRESSDRVVGLLQGGVRDSTVVSLEHHLGPMKLVASGAYTEVMKMEVDEGGKKLLVAVKRLKSQHFNLIDHFMNSMHDCTKWQRCSSLVKIRSVSLAFPPCLIMEYAPLGNLQHFLQSSPSLPSPRQLLSFAESIAQALLFLHDNEDTHHGNLLPNNILIFTSHKSLLAKLSDPGLSRYYSTIPLNQLPYRVGWVRQGEEAASKEGDVYAYGSTLWCMYNHGGVPEDEEVCKLLNNPSYHLPKPPFCPSVLYRLIISCWQVLPHNRPEARDLVRNIRNFYTSEGVYNDYSEEKIMIDKPVKNVIGQRTTSMSGGGVIITNNVDSCDSRTFLINQSGDSSFSANPSTSYEFFPFDVNLDIGEDIDTIPMTFLHFNPLCPLGEGHYGKVYRGTYQRSNGAVIDVAVKCLKKRMYDKYAEEFEKEYMIMKELAHPNVVCVIGRCIDHPASPQILVLEYMEEGCLKLYLNKMKNNLGIRDLLSFGYEIAVGMEFLASKGIVHRDLAARNVLVSAQKQAKIADFGLARALSTERNYYRSDPNKELPAPWCAPESLSYSRFTELTDVWSYGVTMWEVFTYGCAPVFCDLKSLWSKLHEGERLKRTEDFPKKVYDFIHTHCWAFNEEERSPFKQIVQQYEALKKNVIS